MIKSFNIICDKLSCPRPQTRAILGNRGRRSRRRQSPERGYLTLINGKTNKTYRRNAGTYRQRALTYRHKLKKCFGNIKKNAYLCSRKIKITITKNRRPTGYQGHQDYDNIHHPAAHQFRHRRTIRMGNALGNARRRTGNERYPKAESEKKRKRRSYTL